jgi:glycerophosphoryl diester phosphodiesterase
MKQYVKALLGTVAILGCVFESCKTTRTIETPKNFPHFYKEGHRGTRGLMPENTIQAMEKGISVGANVLEMDVYTTKDGQVVVAHDPYINRDHSYLPGGGEIPLADTHKYVLHQMDYAEIKKFDTGSKFYSAFPQQQKLPTYSPLLGELIDSVENYARVHHLPKPIYNIELKNSLQYDNVYNALPDVLSDAVMAVVNSKKIGNRYYLQSFDFRPLQYIHKTYPKVTIGFLTDSKLSFDENIKTLGFKPQLYSPHYKLVTPELIENCHKNNIKIVPWTVDTVQEMKSINALGVDGIITDYPNYFKEIGK